MSETLLKMKPAEALTIAVAIVAVMGFTMIGLGWVPHLSIILVMCGLLAYGAFKRQSFADMQEQMAKGVVSGIARFPVFLYRAAGVGADDVGGDSHADVLWF